MTSHAPSFRLPRYPERVARAGERRVEYTPEQKLEYVNRLLEPAREALASAEATVVVVRQFRMAELTRLTAELQAAEDPGRRPGFFEGIIHPNRYRSHLDRELLRAGITSKTTYLQREIATAEKEAQVRSTEVWRLEQVARAITNRISAAVRAEERRRHKEQVALRKKQEHQDLKAVAARAQKRDRSLAASLRRQMARDHVCPYCGHDMNQDAQLDHIFPVSYGGLSVESNLVFVCIGCNQKKSGLTLHEYIERFRLHAEEVKQRLAHLGKRY